MPRGEDSSTVPRHDAGPAVRQEFARQSPRGTLVSLKLTRANVGRFGDSTVAFRNVTVAKISGVRVTVYQDLVLIAKGRAEVVATFTNALRPFDTRLERALLGKINVRLRSVPKN